MICQECDKKFTTERGLHLHVAKTHKLLLQEYYSKHFPRFDKLDNSQIIFSDTEDYFSRDFNSKDNFAKWCYQADKKEVCNYVVEAFKRRVVKKKSEYIPSHLELKTIFLPSFVGIKQIFGSIKDFIVEIDKAGLQSKYSYLMEPIFEKEFPTVLIDTREQNPLPFPGSNIVKLSCGDYTASENLYSDVFIERKSLPDLVGTLSKGIERFKREIAKAKELEYYIVVVVEDSFNNTLFYSPENSFSYYINGKYIFYRIREICNEFDNVQFVFADSRNKARDIIIKIFQMKDQAKYMDLEYLKDFKYFE